MIQVTEVYYIRHNSLAEAIEYAFGADPFAPMYSGEPEQRLSDTAQELVRCEQRAMKLLLAEKGYTQQ